MKSEFKIYMPIIIALVVGALIIFCAQAGIDSSNHNKNKNTIKPQIRNAAALKKISITAGSLNF